MATEAEKTIDELTKEYGETEVKFSSYYKYSFTFTGKHDGGAEITVCTGGDHNDIYRMNVDADEVYTVSDLEPNYIHAKLPNGDEVSAYEY